jgi:hypothetical protein
MPLERQHAIDLLRRLGYERAADEAELTLPDPVSLDQFQEFVGRHNNIDRDELISQMSGSP